MSRSLYKIPYVHKSLFTNCLNNKAKKKGKVINQKKLKNIAHHLYFWKKNSLVNDNLLFKKIGVYNGKVFLSLHITKPALGYNLGHFCITRIKPPHRGKQKQKKKVQKNIYNKTSIKNIVIERMKKLEKKKSR